MFQVTIEWEGAEIGYGEGETKSYAMQEALECLEGFYAEVPRNELKFTVVRS